MSNIDNFYLEYEKIVALLIKTRKERGISRREISEHCYVCENAIGYFERGRFGLDIMLRYSEALGIKINLSQSLQL